MGRKKLEKISSELKKYIISDNKIEPYVFLYGEEKNTVRTGRLRDLSFSSSKDQGELLKIINSFATNLSDYIEGKLDLIDLNDNND